MSLERKAEQIIPTLMHTWHARHTDASAGDRVIRLIVEHQDAILRETTDIDYPDAEKQFKSLLLHVLPNHIYTTIQAKSLYHFYDFYPEVGQAVLSEALRHAQAYREADCCSQHSEDVKGYSQFIVNVITMCGTVSLPWVQIDEAIYRDRANMTAEINRAIRECLQRRAAKWGQFDAIHAELLAKIQRFPIDKLPALIHSIPFPQLSASPSRNPLMLIWNEIVRRLQIKITPATIELLVVFSEMINAFTLDKREKGITIALAAIKIFAERSRLPVFFGGKNRAGLFAALFGIPYPGASKSEILDAFCARQFEMMTRVVRELDCFYGHQDSRVVMRICRDVSPHREEKAVDEYKKHSVA